MEENQDFSESEHELSCACQDTQQVYRAVDTIEELDELTDHVEQMTNYDPSLDVMVQASVESLLRVANIGYSKGQVADLQSYRNAPDLQEASLESISGVAGVVWSRVITALRSGLTWLVGFIKRIFNRTEDADDNVEKLEEYAQKWKASKHQGNKVAFALTPQMAMFADARSLGTQSSHSDASEQTMFRATFYTAEWLKKDGVNSPDFFGSGRGTKLEGLKSFPNKSISDNLAGTVFGIGWDADTAKDMATRKPINYSSRVTVVKEAIPNTALAKEVNTTIANAKLWLLAEKLKDYKKSMDKLKAAIDMTVTQAEEYLKEAERKTGRAASDIEEGNKAQYARIQRCLFIMTGPSVKYYHEAVRVYATAAAEFLREVRRTAY